MRAPGSTNTAAARAWAAALMGAAILAWTGILAGVPFLSPIDNHLNEWATAHNPVFNGPYADALSMLFFLGLAGFLYLVGSERMLAPKRAAPA